MMTEATMRADLIKGLIVRLRFRAECRAAEALAAGKHGKEWAADTFIEWQAADALAALQSAHPQEPVAWQHRVFHEDTSKWSSWRDGRRDNLLANVQEERPLFTSPVEPVGAAKAEADVARLQAELARYREALKRIVACGNSANNYDGDRLSPEEVYMGAVDDMFDIARAALGGSNDR